MEGAVPIPICPNCHRQVPYRQVSTNANGNQGRLLAKCNQWINPVTNIQCNFFFWHPSSRHDASSGQFQPAVNFISQPLASFQSLVFPPAPSQVKCLTVGCNSARIWKGCTNQCCKHHCQERGGCLSHGNMQPDPVLPTPNPHSVPASSTLPPIFTDTALTPPLSSVADPSPWSSNPLVETQPPTTPIATRVLHRAEPTHASHILPIFTEQWATEHSLREEQRKQDAEKLANLQKTKHTVFVYAWTQDNVEPTVIEVQEGFTWPHLVLNSTVLAQAGMADVVRLNLFRTSLGMWTLINRGHVIELTENSRIFIKTVDVQDCKSLVKHTLPAITPPRGRLDITGERAYIRQRALQDEIVTSPSPSTHIHSPLATCGSPAPAILFTPHPQPKVHSTTTIRKKRRRSAEVVEIDSDSDSPVIMSAASHQRQLNRLVKEEPLSPGTMGGHISSMKTWPTDFSVEEVSNGFRNIEALAAQQDHTIKTAFEEVFKVPYVNGTYYSHLQQWKCATQESQNAAHGSWSDFMKMARAPDADIKAARKRVKRRNMKLVSASASSSVDSGDRM